MRKPRGFAMVFAITCVAVSAAALAVAGVMVAGESRRTRLAQEDLQLRQLLIAGQEIAATRLPLTASVDVKLPPQLISSGATLRLSPTSNSDFEEVIDVEAALPRHRMAQTLHYAKDSTGWRLVHVDLP